MWIHMTNVHLTPKTRWHNSSRVVGLQLFTIPPWSHPHPADLTTEFLPLPRISPLVEEEDTGSDSVGLRQILLQWLPWRSEYFQTLSPQSGNVKDIKYRPQTEVGDCSSFFCSISLLCSGLYCLTRSCVSASTIRDVTYFYDYYWTALYHFYSIKFLQLPFSRGLVTVPVFAFSLSLRFWLTCQTRLSWTTLLAGCLWGSKVRA